MSNNTFKRCLFWTCNPTFLYLSSRSFQWAKSHLWWFDFSTLSIFWVFGESKLPKSIWVQPNSWDDPILGVIQLRKSIWIQPMNHGNAFAWLPKSSHFLWKYVSFTLCLSIPPKPISCSALALVVSLRPKSRWTSYIAN